MNSKDPFVMDAVTMKRHLTSKNMKQNVEALRSIGINGTFITILEDIYTGATERVHMDNQVPGEIPILRGVRQGDPIFPKLFTTKVQLVFKNAQLEEKAINIDGEKLPDLRFADEVALPEDWKIWNIS